MRLVSVFILLVLTALFSGCSNTIYVPVEERSYPARPYPDYPYPERNSQYQKDAAPAQPNGIEVTPYKNSADQPPVIISSAEPVEPIAVKKKTPSGSVVPRQAVLDFLAKSQQAIKEERYQDAESLLERAIRLEPRNPWLWYNLAVVKYYQNDFNQSVQMAKKSNQLNPDNTKLRKDSWKVIEKSYLALGESSKAEEARRQSQ